MEQTLSASAVIAFIVVMVLAILATWAYLAWSTRRTRKEDETLLGVVRPVVSHRRGRGWKHRKR